MVGHQEVFLALTYVSGFIMHLKSIHVPPNSSYGDLKHVSCGYPLDPKTCHLSDHVLLTLELVK